MEIWKAWGEGEGNNLSPKWSQICGDLLNAKVPSFDYVLGGALSHICTKFSSA